MSFRHETRLFVKEKSLDVEVQRREDELRLFHEKIVFGLSGMSNKIYSSLSGAKMFSSRIERHVVMEVSSANRSLLRIKVSAGSRQSSKTNLDHRKANAVGKKR